MHGSWRWNSRSGLSWPILLLTKVRKPKQLFWNHHPYISILESCIFSKTSLENSLEIIGQDLAIVVPFAVPGCAGWGGLCQTAQGVLPAWGGVAAMAERLLHGTAKASPQVRQSREKMRGLRKRHTALWEKAVEPWEMGLPLWKGFFFWNIQLKVLFVTFCDLGCSTNHSVHVQPICTGASLREATATQPFATRSGRHSAQWPFAQSCHLRSLVSHRIEPCFTYFFHIWNIWTIFFIWRFTTNTHFKPLTSAAHGRLGRGQDRWTDHIFASEKLCHGPWPVRSCNRPRRSSRFGTTTSSKESSKDGTDIFASWNLLIETCWRKSWEKKVDARLLRHLVKHWWVRSPLFNKHDLAMKKVRCLMAHESMYQ